MYLTVSHAEAHERQDSLFLPHDVWLAWCVTVAFVCILDKSFYLQLLL